MWNLEGMQVTGTYLDEVEVAGRVTLSHVAYGGGVNYSDAFGTVGIWETTLYIVVLFRTVVFRRSKVVLAIVVRNSSADTLRIQR